MYFSLSLPAPPEIQTQQATRPPTKMSTPIPADAPDSSQSTVVEMSTALTCTLSLGKSVSGINISHGQDEPIFAATLPHRCQAGARQGHGLSMEKERLTLHPDNKLSDQIVLRFQSQICFPIRTMMALRLPLPLLTVKVT